MKYNIAEVGDYKAVHITLPNNYKIYVNNLHPHYNSIVEVLEDNTVDNSDVVYMLLVCNFVNLEVDIDELNYAITVNKAIEVSKQSEALQLLLNSPEENIFVNENELTDIVYRLSQNGEALGFDYTPQIDFENEEDFSHVRQAVFPAMVLDGVLLGFDSEGNGVSYYVAGISNISYLGMYSEEETIKKAKENNRFVNWIKKLWKK